MLSILEPDPVSTGVGSRISSQCKPSSTEGETFPLPQRRKDQCHRTQPASQASTQEEAKKLNSALASQRNRYRRSYRSSLCRHLLDLGHRSSPPNRTRSSTRIRPSSPAHGCSAVTLGGPARQARSRALRRNRRSIHFRTHRRRMERRNLDRGPRPSALKSPLAIFCCRRWNATVAIFSGALSGSSMVLTKSSSTTHLNRSAQSST